MKQLTLLFFISLIISISAAPAKEESETKAKRLKVAVICIDESDETSAKTADLANMELMQKKDIETLEREQIGKLLQEQQIIVSKETPFHMNNVLRADLIFTTRKSHDLQGRRIVKLTAFDTRHGTRTLEEDFPYNANTVLNRLPESISKAINDCRKEKLPPVYSIAPLKSLDEKNINSKFQEIISAEIQKEIIKSGHPCIEFAEARKISDEMHLSQGIDRPQQVETYIFIGEFKTVKKGNKKFLETQLYQLSSLPGAADKRNIYKASIELKNGTPSEKDIRKLASKLVSGKKADSSGQISIKNEEERLIKSAQERMKKRDAQIARKELETALLFNPSSIAARKLLLDVYSLIITKMKNDLRRSPQNSTYFPGAYEIFKSNLQNMEWLTRKKELYPTRYLEKKWALYNLKRISKDKTLAKSRIQEQKKQYVIIAKYILSQGNHWPIDSQITASRLYNQYSGNLSKKRSDTENVRIYKDFLIKFGDKIPTSKIFHIKRQENLIPALKLLLEDDKISTNLRCRTEKELKYLSDYSKTKPVKDIPIIPFDNTKELKELSETPDQKYALKKSQDLLKDARKNFEKNKLNKTRLSYEALQKKGEKLDIEDEMRLAISYSGILNAFPYSHPPKQQERELAINYVEKGLDCIERILNYQGDKRYPPEYFAQICEIARIKKNLDMGLDFESDLPKETKKQTTKLMKRIKNMCEQNVDAEIKRLTTPPDFKNMKPPRGKQGVTVHIFDSQRNSSREQFLRSMREQYMDTFVYLIKDPKKLFSELNKTNLKHYPGSYFSVAPYFLNIYLYKDPPKAVALYKAFLKESKSKTGKEHVKYLMEDYINEVKNQKRYK